MATKAITTQSNESIALWETGAAPAGFETISKPTILKLRDLPIGGFIDCKPLELVESTTKGINQPLLLVELTKDKTRVALPMQASLANTLLDEDQEKCKYIGKRVLIRKTGVKTSAKYKDDNGNPRQFALYEVAVAAK
jgi:hypothetical protein